MGAVGAVATVTLFSGDLEGTGVDLGKLAVPSTKLAFVISVYGAGVLVGIGVGATQPAPSIHDSPVAHPI